MKISMQTMRLIHRAHLQYDIPKNDLITWAATITGGAQNYVRVSETTHLYDRIHGETSTDWYLNRLHVGIFGMRISFARQVGWEGNPLDLLDPFNNIHYFSRYLSHLRDLTPERQITYLRGCVIMPPGFNGAQFRFERSRLMRLQVVK